ncbi:MAG: hypothetical protein OXI35_17725, partial [Gemmatimonadota bacterium]|nr:hypothetical protein [Gemmatimonadota bacterium]
PGGRTSASPSALEALALSTGSPSLPTRTKASRLLRPPAPVPHPPIPAIPAQSRDVSVRRFQSDQLPPLRLVSPLV